MEETRNKMRRAMTQLLLEDCSIREEKKIEGQGLILRIRDRLIQLGLKHKNILKRHGWLEKLSKKIYLSILKLSK